MLRFTLLFCFLAAAATSSDGNHRIVGGNSATIETYPFAAVVFRSQDLGNYVLRCGGVIINNRSIMSATSCFSANPNPALYRFRIGSSYASSGGVVHNVSQIILHPEFDDMGWANDIAIVQSTSLFTYGPSVQAIAIAGPPYNLPDNQALTAIGWGSTSAGGPLSEQLQSVALLKVNWNTCRQTYIDVLYIGILNNIICAARPGANQCAGDTGGPLLHWNNEQNRYVAVGVLTNPACSSAVLPNLNTKVSDFASWIQANA